MTRVSPFARANARILEKLADEAVYKKASGETVNIEVMASRGDAFEPDGHNNTRLTKQNVFEFKKSVILEPAQGDEIIYDGKTYIIVSEPLEDNLNLVWTVFCDISVGA